ncbi:hypothetical protein LEN26_004007 [Aphanomyces euteiches]|nr:hypothetical protein AeMF1_019775 [Aphanomyces euteiches]KAH9150824.1 hypothetical protein LEN26_004007 [Aphanomyces euteiches]KAH9194899.1 hypothetical protein AeNC1_003121 [Aphanomyces euteiches]
MLHNSATEAAKAPPEVQHAMPAQPPPCLIYTRRNLLSTAAALVAFLTGLLVLYIYGSGAKSAMDSLKSTQFGINGSTFIYAQYESPLLMSFVKLLKTDAPSVVPAFQQTIQNASVVYIVQADETSTLEFTTTNCVASGGTVTDIHDPQVVRDFVSLVYSGLGASFTNDLIAVIDCNFGAIVGQDSSTFRVHVVDPKLTYITTISTEAMQMTRPQMRQKTVSMPVIVVNTTFASIKMTPPYDDYSTAFSRPLAPTDVRVLVAIGYPFEDAIFQPLAVERVNEQSQIEGTLVWPNNWTESVYLNAYDGTYRDESTIFGYYFSFSIHIPDDAASNLGYLSFVGVPQIKNSWAWGYLLVCLQLCLVVALDMFSAVLVAVGTSRRVQFNVFHTLPDISHHLEKAILVHAILSIPCCLLDGGWAWYEWSVSSAQLRNIYNTNTIPRPLHIWCILLSWTVFVCTAMTKILRCNFSSTAILFVCLVADAHETYFNGPWGLFVEFSAQCMMDSNAESLTPSRSLHLDIWSYHSQPTLKPKFVLNEVSGFVYAAGFLLTTQVLMKVIYLIHGRLRRQVSPHSSDDKAISFPFEDGQTNTPLRGLFLSFDKHEEDKASSTILATPAWVWYLGDVVVDDVFVFRLTDVPKLWLNQLLRRDYFHIYGYDVTLNEVNTNLKLFLHEDFQNAASLWRLSLVPVHQKHLQDNKVLSLVNATRKGSNASKRTSNGSKKSKVHVQPKR